MRKERGDKLLGLEACVGTHRPSELEHLNTRWVIGTVHQGNGEIRLLGRSVTLRDGGFLIVPPGVLSQTHWRDFSRVSTLFCWPEHFDEEVDQMGRFGVRPGVGEDRGFVSKIAALARSVTQHHDDIDEHYLNFLDSLSAVVMEDALRPLPYAPKAIRRVRDFLHAEYTQKISLDQMADIAGLSRFHIHKAFRASVGVPPHTYLMQLRLERARALLSRGWSVSEVAVEVGFYDQSHFTRSFRKSFGLTPRDFAQQTVFSVEAR